MTTPPLVQEATTPDLMSLRNRVMTCLDEFLAGKAEAASAHSLSPEVAQHLAHFLHAGGKRLRPVFCVAGWHAAGGRGAPPDQVVQIAAALELFHAFALIHDDIMDNSATRRGHPTVHCALAQALAGARDPVRTGTGCAILVGDMALAWAHQLLGTAHLPPDRHAVVRSLFHRMGEEVIHGQYLDLQPPSRAADPAEAALQVIRYKTAKYTIERPLHIGAALAGADSELLDTLTQFALPLGEAFQLRDDLLGVFGHPHQTGKPVLDDLREGKHTLLIALASQHAYPSQRTVLDHMLGDPHLDEEAATGIREILNATGAPVLVETLITTRHRQALSTLDNAPIPPPAAALLRQLAALAVERAS